MLDWLASLNVLEQILLYIAVPATVLLLLQTALLLAGGGGEESGADGDSLDMDGDGIHDLHLGHLDIAHTDAHCDLCGESHDGHIHEGGGAGGLHLLTLRGLVAFFSLFGWSGLLLCQMGLHALLALFLAVQIGITGMVGVALLLREALRLQSDGTLDIRNALGREGSVYLKVPAGRSGQGKVNVVVQEQMHEFEAVTDSESPIPTGAKVIVIGVTGGDTLVVSKKEEP
jgi:hypothetical protein